MTKTRLIIFIAVIAILAAPGLSYAFTKTVGGVEYECSRVEGPEWSRMPQLYCVRVGSPLKENDKPWEWNYSYDSYGYNSPSYSYNSNQNYSHNYGQSTYNQPSYNQPSYNYQSGYNYNQPSYNQPSYNYQSGYNYNYNQPSYEYSY